MGKNIIQLKNVWNIKTLISQLNFLNTAKKGDTVNISILLNAKVIMPQYLAIIVAAINEAKSHGVKVVFGQKKDLQQKDQKFYYNSYASRMNFYQLLGINIKESFFRRNSAGKFIEITQHDVVTQSDVSDIKLVSNIIKIFEEHYKVDKSVVAALNFCLWEIIDNIKNHSMSETKYTVVAQYYPNSDEIRLCIIDNGIGIHRALTETVGSKYRMLSPKESLMRCTENSVTDGKGAGYGLYSYKNFVQKNNGHLIIYSGNYYQEVKGEKVFVDRVPFWQGTIIYNKINIKHKIDFKEVFGESIPTTVSEYKECINDLW